MNLFLKILSKTTSFIFIFYAVILWPLHSTEETRIKILIGPEMTFTNETIRNDTTKFYLPKSENTKNMKLLISLIKEKCSECTVVMDSPSSPSAKIIYPDGWYFIISIDPAVIEVNTSPMSVDKLREVLDRIKKDLYINAESIDLRPHSIDGGGHIHIDLKSAFNDDSKKFRNFVVDFYNHKELSQGILGKCRNNSPHICDLPERNNDDFKAVINKFDNAGGAISDLTAAIHSNVYTGAKWGPVEKYQALNLTRVVEKDLPIEDRTIEIRAIRPQGSPEALLLQARLFEERINFLNKQTGAIPIKDNMDTYTPRQKFIYFKNYVEETGLKWADYAGLIPNEYDKYIWHELLQASDPELKFKYLRDKIRNMPYDLADETLALVFEKLEQFPPSKQTQVVTDELVARKSYLEITRPHFKKLLLSKNWKDSAGPVPLINNNSYNECISDILTVLSY